MITLRRAIILRWARSATTIGAGLFLLLTLILARRLASSDRFSQLISSPSTWRDLLMCLAASALLAGPLACMGIWLRMRQEGSLATLLVSTQAARTLEQASITVAAATAAMVGGAVLWADWLLYAGTHQPELVEPGLQWRPWPEHAAINLAAWIPQELIQPMRQHIAEDAKLGIRPIVGASIGAMATMIASRFGATTQQNSAPRMWMSFLNVAAMCAALCAASPWLAIAVVALCGAILETRFRRKGIRCLP